jgi:biopolymer transport protein ExbB
MSWGGLFACAGLGLAVLLERVVRLRRKQIIPAEFTARFLDRLHEGKLDGGRALDYCEMNPSPAARVALAAVRRWGRQAVDLERVVAIRHRVEVALLRRNVGTLRRIAVLAPALGLLGSLLAVARGLAAIYQTSATEGSAPLLVLGEPASAASVLALANALSPLILGLTIATLALVAYDLIVIRIERFSGELDRLGAEIIDAIAMATQPVAVARIDSASSPPVRRADQGQAAANSISACSPHHVQYQGRHVDGLVPPNVTSDHEIGF